MEERKKLGPVGVIGLVLLLLILALACYLSAGLNDLSLGLGPWGVYSTDEQSLYLVTAYEQTDTGDLLIVLLLLLMAGDCPEDQNTALLTLAIYLFL